MCESLRVRLFVHRWIKENRPLFDRLAKRIVAEMTPEERQERWEQIKRKRGVH